MGPHKDPLLAAPLGVLVHGKVGKLLEHLAPEHVVAARGRAPECVHNLTPLGPLRQLADVRVRQGGWPAGSSAEKRRRDAAHHLTQPVALHSEHSGGHSVVGQQALVAKNKLQRVHSWASHTQDEQPRQGAQCQGSDLLLHPPCPSREYPSLPAPTGAEGALCA